MKVSYYNWGPFWESTIEEDIGISFCIASYWEESLGIVDPVPGSYWNEPAVNGTGSLGPYISGQSLISLEHNDYY